MLEHKIERLIEESFLIPTLIIAPIASFLVKELLTQKMAILNGKRIAEHTTKKEFLNSIMKDKDVGKLSPNFATKGFTEEVFGKKLETAKGKKRIKGLKETYTNAKGHIYFTSGEFLPNLVQRLYYITVLNDPKKENNAGLLNIIITGLYYTFTDPIFNNSKTKTLFLELPDDEKELKKRYKSDPNTGIKGWAFRSDKSKKVYASQYKLLYDIVLRNFKKAFRESKGK